MYILRLFRHDDPTRQVTSRTLEAGELTIGRDGGASWKIDDPNREISRLHCTVAATGQGLTITDTSTNGVLMGPQKARLPANRPVPLALGDTLHLGGFILTVERAPEAAGASRHSDPFPPPAPATSPFAPPPGQALRADLSAPRGAEPFASALRPDPLAFGAPPERRRDGSVLPGDVWETRTPPRAGDWNATSSEPRLEHHQLIGSDRAWSEPLNEGPGELGFGFDAPFHRPLLQDVAVSAQSLVIPSDWDAPEPRPAPAQRPLPPEPAAPEPFAAEPLARDPFARGPFAPAAFAPAPPPTSTHPAGRFDDRPPAPSLAPTPAPAPAPPLASSLASSLAPPPPAAPARPDAAAPGVPELPPPRASAPRGGEDENRLLNAFCDGAKLDPADLSGEDPVEVMRRAGVLYQQMVLGLSDLLSERTSLKNEYRMMRTTVRAEGNNPFKWAPPRRVALDLLRGRDDGFLTGPAAVRESFEDLKKHLLCLLSGMRASLAAALEALSPAATERRLKAPTLPIRGNRGAAAWAEYGRLYADFRHQADDNPDSQINREFRAAYERQLRELDDLSAKN